MTDLTTDDFLRTASQLKRSRMHMPTVYPSLMDIAAILRELDFEIAKLRRIRAIVQSLDRPVRRHHSRPSKRSEKQAALTTPAVALSTEPKLIVLPPKTKREHSPRLRPAASETRALASNIPIQPVFVPRSTLAKPVERQNETVETSPEILEATIRQKLLGVPAAGLIRTS